MDGFNPLDTQSAIFQLHRTQTERTVSAAKSGLRAPVTSDAKLQDVSQQFESLLLNFMIREMRATVPESTLFPPSMAQEIFNSMLDQQTAGQMAENGGIGISRLVFNQLKQGE